MRFCAYNKMMRQFITMMIVCCWWWLIHVILSNHYVVIKSSNKLPTEGRMKAIKIMIIIIRMKVLARPSKHHNNVDHST